MKERTDQEWRGLMIRRHHIWGWCGLLVFVSFGIGLDALHAFKIGFYLDPSLDTRRALWDSDWHDNSRRFLWMLAHRHGTLLALVHLAFAFSLQCNLLATVLRVRLAGYFLLNAIVLMPLGFFLGGISPSEADPGIGILLVPLGALFLFLAVLLIAAQALSSHESNGIRSPKP